jgi:hypothetical protein
MKKIIQNFVVLTLALSAILPMNAIAAFVGAETEVVVIAEAPQTKTLAFKKDIKVADIEQYLGRKMTGLEKLGFKLNKKKLVKALNAPQLLNSDATNTWAIVGFVCSLIIPVLGIIFSAIALGQIRRSGERGRGLALAGLIIGIVFTAIAIIGVL